MQTSKARNGSSEVPQKTSPITPKSSRGSKKIATESDSVTSKLTPGKSSAEKSPKITERRSPKSPNFEKKRLVRQSDLEHQVAQLQDELKKTKDQLNSSESLKKKVQLESEEAKKQLKAMEEKLEETECKLVEFSAAEDDRIQQLHQISQERDKAWQSELEALQEQRSNDSAALGSAMNEIQKLKQQLDMVLKSETSHVEDFESEQNELVALKKAMETALSTVENLKVQINEKEMAEKEAKLTAYETQKELEMANTTIESLRSEGCNLQEYLNSETSKLEESRVRINALEEMVKELQSSVEDDEIERGKPPFEVESVASQSELEQLRAALEAAEAKLQEEQIQTTMKIQSAFEMAEHVKFDAGLRELELESTLQKTKAELFELKARLLSLETELPGISQINKELKDEMDEAKASQFESEMRLIKATTDVTELKANILDKETQLQSIMEENEQIKSELSKRDIKHQKNYAAAISDAEKAKAAEHEALMRLEVVNGEAEKISKKATKLSEQLEAAQAVKSEMEIELKRLRVQSDQWRKAAEAAAAVLTPGNNGRIVERTGSLDSDYNSLSGKLISSPFSDELDDDSPKRKNGNMLRKIGGLWKKGSK
ncbi:interactor of constitutive active ROPs 2, chloroplastic [Dendrobium catenatum]|uniref:Interactor of constitutive active ROPs 2, chloroplastic n=1 Tax=Dendrobium catenatum TaxID=906689 RepID=A0A2I0W0M9_9ASPA|nr:interactor of constitutive active ROPs 2, chloroplastic [Dendrobium catenatum]PKU69207.1 Interactor of constitutive active ROPs 2, chloroplastic [Dendrobium catenatum]